MAVATELVLETRLDVGKFVTSAMAVTQQNHAQATDSKRMVSQLAADVAIIDDFADDKMHLSLAVTYVGFLVGGAYHDVDEIIANTRGMAHVPTNYVDGVMRLVLIVGSLDQWQKTIVEGCKAHPLGAARAAFNQIYQALCQKGFSKLFEGFKTKDHRDGTFLIERS
jgi:hypothetical protein